ncbi:hypothetical protein EV2_014367 [Malus domestica]
MASLTSVSQSQLLFNKTRFKLPPNLSSGLLLNKFSVSFRRMSFRVPMKVAAAASEVVSATTAEKAKKRYPGEAKGFVEEMRFVAMKLHIRDQAKEREKEVKEPQEGLVAKWEPTVDGYLKFLVDRLLKSIESDAICHIDGPPPCKSDNIVATQESNVVVEHSHLTQGVQICISANQYPIVLHTNENMALLLELSQGGHPNTLYKESEIGNISYPTMHGNYVQGQQYPYWNGGFSMYNMHSSTSTGNDGQELN